MAESAAQDLWHGFWTEAPLAHQHGQLPAINLANGESTSPHFFWLDLDRPERRSPSAMPVAITPSWVPSKTRWGQWR